MNFYYLIGGGILGFCVGILTGLFGAGGGFIVTPALNIFLGLEMDLAVGTSAFQVLGASAFSLYHHLDRRVMGIKVAALTAICIPLGSFLGKSLVEHFRRMGTVNVAGKEILAVNFILLCIFAVFLMLIASWLLFDSFYLSRHKDDDDGHKGFLSLVKIPPMIKFRTIPSGPFSAPVLICIGLFVGFIGGLLGIGGGVIMMPILFYLVGQDTKYAARTGTMLVFVSGLFTTIFYAIAGQVEYLLVVFLISGAFFGTRVGAKIQEIISGKSIRKYFAFVVLAAAVMVIVKLYFMIYIKKN